MKSAENNCGEGRNGSALRPHTRHEKPVSSDQDTGLRAAGATDAPAGVSLYGFARKIPITELAPNFSNSRFMSVKLIPVVRISSISKTSRPSM